MTILEFSLLSFLATYNSPFPARPTLIPSMSVELRPTSFLYLKQTDSARCTPDSINIWHPISGLYQVELGIRLGGQSQYQIGIGHRSEHGIDQVVSSTESFDYVRLDYKIELK